MIRSFRFRWLVVPVLTCFLGAQVTPELAEKIKLEGREKSKVMAHLDHLVNRIGPRLTSSDNLTVACEWARDTFKSFGIENARLEQWGTFPVGFNRGPWWGRIVAPERMELVCNTFAWTAGTRAPSKGPVVLCPKNEEELEAAKGTLHGKWLVDPPRGSGGFRRKLEAAMLEEGAFGFLSAGGDLLLTDGNRGIVFDALPQIPNIRLRTDGYRALKGFLADGSPGSESRPATRKQPVVAEFDIRNHFRNGPIPLYNVLADIPGTEFPDEYVVVGGHLDSWDGATGTTDNGTGTATTIEAARILMAVGAKPRRTIRFMLWTGEEQGLLGSRAWVNEHKSEMPNYSACLVHDGGTNYLSGIAGMEAMKPALEEVFAPIVDLDPDKPFKVGTIRAFTPIGSDHESFTAAGVPGFFWNQAGRSNYARTHHTQYDTFDAAIEDYQKHSSVVIAVGALGIANLPEKLTREGMRVQRGFGGMPPGAQSAPSGRVLGVMIGEGTSIDEVIEGSLAATVGLKSGDRITRIGDRQVKTQEEIAPALREGPLTTKVTVDRGGKEQVFEVTFQR